MKRFLSVMIFVLAMAGSAVNAQVRTEPRSTPVAGAEPSAGKSFVQAQPDKPGKAVKPPPAAKKTTPVLAPKSFRAEQENAPQSADAAPQLDTQAKPESSAGVSPESSGQGQTPPEFPPTGDPRRGPGGGGFPPRFSPRGGRPGMGPEGMRRGPGEDGAEGDGPPRGMRPMGPRPFPPPFMGRLRGLPPEEQEKILRNNQRFQALPKEQQERMLERWRRFMAMTPEQRGMIEKRFNNFNRLTPEQQQKAREMVPRWQSLAPERRREMLGEFRKLRGMSPEEREKYLDSKDLETRFNSEEREMLKQLGTFAPPFPPPPRRFGPRGEGFPPGPPPEPPSESRPSEPR